MESSLRGDEIFTNTRMRSEDQERLLSEQSSDGDDTDMVLEKDRVPTKVSYFMVVLLFFVNLLNYIDRYTIAGVLKDIQKFFVIDNAKAGLIQTVFVISYMVFSPIFGYMGDRFSRKYIMMFGILFWSGITLAGSFVGKHDYWLFLLLRGLVGIGEASYVTVAPTIIADLFRADKRTRMLIIFNIATPIGSGLGYIVGSNVAKLFGQWNWALRVTPIFGVLFVFLMICMPEPKRGSCDGAVTLQNTNMLVDLQYLRRNKSFIYVTLGFTSVAFSTGTLALWGPSFVIDALKVQGDNTEETTIDLIFGAILVVAGLLGVSAGGEAARYYRKYNPRADPLVCAFGLFFAAPFLFIGLYAAHWNAVVLWICIFVGEVMLCLNWSIVNDILLGVVIPTRRSLAMAVQIFVCHALGDAGSPYLVGVISDSIADSYKMPRKAPVVEFESLQSALYVTPFICVLGAGMFLANAIYIERDKRKAEYDAKENPMITRRLH